MPRSTDLDAGRRATLERRLADRLGEPSAEIVEWRRASQGMSDETIFVTARTSTGDRALVLRRYRDEGVCRELGDPSRHFRVLRALSGSGVPVPTALWLEDDPALLGGAFFAMERVAGFVPVPWSAEGRAFLAAAGRGPIGEQFVDVLARIHRVDVTSGAFSFLERPAPGRAFALAQIELLAALVERYRDEPEPILEDALGWLRTTAPEAVATTLVHGDYRTGNLIYEGDRIAAVLDWEFAGLGDPMLDVAWVTARSNRMDSDLVCFLLPRQLFLDRYQAATGWRCDAQALRFWEMFHQVRNAVIWLSGGHAYATGRSDDLRLARMALTMPVMRKMVAELLDEA